MYYILNLEAMKFTITFKKHFQFPKQQQIEVLQRYTNSYFYY